MSLRAALAALLVYVAVGLSVAVPPDEPLWPVLFLGTAFLVLGLRTGRVVLLGAALVLPGVAWTVRAARGDGGAGVGALMLGLGLTVVILLARLALDAAPREGPVRMDPAVRRQLARDGAAVCALGLAGGALALAVAGPDHGGRIPTMLLPLSVLSVPLLLGVVAGMVALVRRNHPCAWSRRRRRWLASALLAATVLLPLSAALGARAPFPPGGSSSVSPSPPAPTPANASPDTTSPTAPDRQPLDAAPAGGPGSRMVLLAVTIGVGLLAAVLLGGGERLVPTDDRRPDRSPPDEALRGAPPAPTVETLPREEAAQFLDEALLHLRDELDVRLAIRCAYASVATGLGHREHARLPAESELEFLDRQLRLLGAGGPALRQLTDLFELARFSDHLMDEAMRADAVAALDEVRRALAATEPVAAVGAVGTAGAAGAVWRVRTVGR